MKINARSFKHIKSYVVFCLLVTLMFPYSLLAAESKYSVPKNSLSYFLQNPSQKKYLETTTESPSGSVIPPLTSIEASRNEQPVTKAKVHSTPQGQEQDIVQEVYSSKPSTDIAQEELTMSWHNETPDEMHVPINSSKVVVPQLELIQAKKGTVTEKTITKATASKVKPIRLAKEYQRKPVAQKQVFNRSNTQQTIVASVPATNSPFARALAKMRSRKADREAEAQRLGVTLPSHNGDIASVSPSLSKINSTVNQILARHAANNSRV